MTSPELTDNRGSLSEGERIGYTDAVRCLQSKPAATPSEEAPGAITRFDDFVATHINQSMTIHYTGNFLSWHRYYTFLYEEALQKECGYEGTQPVSPNPGEPKFEETGVECNGGRRQECTQRAEG